MCAASLAVPVCWAAAAAHLKKTGPSDATLGAGTAHVLFAGAAAGHPKGASRRAAADAVAAMRAGAGLPAAASAALCAAGRAAAGLAGAGASAGAGAVPAGGKQSTLVSVMGSGYTRQLVSGRPARTATLLATYPMPQAAAGGLEGILGQTQDAHAQKATKMYLTACRTIKAASRDAHVEQCHACKRGRAAKPGRRARRSAARSCWAGP